MKILIFISTIAIPIGAFKVCPLVPAMLGMGVITGYGMIYGVNEKYYISEG